MPQRKFYHFISISGQHIVLCWGVFVKPVEEDVFTLLIVYIQ